MTIDLTKESLESCKLELESLMNFRYDNLYVGRLIADRMLQLQLTIKTYEDMIRSRD